MVLLIAFFAVSIIFSFLCSIWEAVLLSIPPSFVEIKRQEGGFVGEKLAEFKDRDKIDQPLAAILTLNTIAHTVGAIGVGASATQVWPDNEFVTGAVVPVVMTLMILILSELIPKTLGANNWKGLAGFTVTSLNFVIKLLFPLVWLGQWITKALKKNKHESVLSRADFKAMADLGQEEGVIDKSESKIINNLLKFKTVLAKNVMTPRTVMISANEDMTVREFYDQFSPIRFSRIPVYTEQKEEINGFVLKDELLEKLVHDQDDLKLNAIKRPIMVINDTMPVPDLFNKMMEKREHVALVVGEFGGVSGLVTMEDVIETLLGLEIVDELDNTEDMQALARKNWEKRAKNLGIIDESENNG